MSERLRHGKLEAHKETAFFVFEAYAKHLEGRIITPNNPVAYPLAPSFNDSFKYEDSFLFVLTISGNHSIFVNAFFELEIPEDIFLHGPCDRRHSRVACAYCFPV